MDLLLYIVLCTVLVVGFAFKVKACFSKSKPDEGEVLENEVQPVPEHTTVLTEHSMGRETQVNQKARRRSIRGRNISSRSSRGFYDDDYDIDELFSMNYPGAMHPYYSLFLYDWFLDNFDESTLEYGLKLEHGLSFFEGAVFADVSTHGNTSMIQFKDESGNVIESVEISQDGTVVIQDNNYVIDGETGSVSFYSEDGQASWGLDEGTTFANEEASSMEELASEIESLGDESVESVESVDTDLERIVDEAIASVEVGSVELELESITEVGEDDAQAETVSIAEDIDSSGDGTAY